MRAGILAQTRAQVATDSACDRGDGQEWAKAGRGG